MKTSSKPGRSTSAHTDDVRAMDPLDRLIVEERLRIKRIDPMPDGSALVLGLTNGATLFAPLDDVPQLAKASAKQRLGFSIIAGGTAIGWDALDVHLSLKGFLLSVVRSEVIRRLTAPSTAAMTTLSPRPTIRKQRIRA